jgi:hypothetical protein
MDHSAADELLRQLPTAHAIALRLQRSGQSASIIALALGIDVADVTGLLELAERKLAALSTPAPRWAQPAPHQHAE